MAQKTPQMKRNHLLRVHNLKPMRYDVLDGEHRVVFSLESIYWSVPHFMHVIIMLGVDMNYNGIGNVIFYEMKDSPNVLRMLCLSFSGCCHIQLCAFVQEQNELSIC